MPMYTSFELIQFTYFDFSVLLLRIKVEAQQRKSPFCFQPKRAMGADHEKDVPSSCAGTLDCNQGAVRAVRWNVDGNYMLTCGSDKSMKLWNPKRKAMLKSYSGHGNEVLDARGSCDNAQLVSCGADKTVIVWDVSTGVASRKLRGHAGTVNCVR